MKIFPNHEDSCYRYDSKEHWLRICRIPKYLVELYQASLKGKGKKINFAQYHELEDHTTHLDTLDFIEDFVGNDDDN